MEQPIYKIIWQRSKRSFRRLLERVRRIRFRQVMGAVYFARVFNPLLILVVLFVFFWLMGRDIARSPVIVESRAAIDANVTFVQNEIEKISFEMRKLKADFAWLGIFVDVVAGALRIVADVINGIISVVNALNPFDDIDFINIDIPALRVFTDSIAYFQSIVDSFTTIFSSARTALGETWAILLKWWGYFKILFFVGLAWLGVSWFAGIYTNLSLGRQLMRTQPEEERKERSPLRRRYVFETPPILVVDAVRVNLPQVVELHKDEVGRKGQRVLRREQFLLSAEAVWPDRSQAMYHYELAEMPDEDAWDIFWENLIGRGLNPDQVQMVISSRTEALLAPTQSWLPEAKVQTSVDTTIIY
jgi:hypothetical protein